MFQKLRNKINASIVLQTTMKVTAVFVLVVIVLAVVIMRMFFSQMERRIVADQQVIVEKIANGVNYPFENVTAPMITLANNNSAVALLNNKDNMYSSVWMSNMRNLNLYLTNVNLFSNYILDVAIIRPDSTVVYTMGSTYNRNYNYCEQEWFQEALLQENVIKFALPHGREHYYHAFSGSDYAATAIFPVLQSEKLIGYVLLEVDITRASDIFTTDTTEESGFLLVSDKGEIIYDYLSNKREEKPLSLDDQLTGGSVRFVENNSLYVGQQLSSNGWYVLSETDYSVITKPAWDIVKAVLVLLCSSLVVVLLVVFHMVRTTRKPLNSLILRISSYDGSGAIELDDVGIYTGEFLTVRQKFEEMADKISALINEVYRAQMHQQDMELKALMNQINPHFLYNVLQLIQTKAVLADNREIEDMITSLGQMLRYTMDRKTETVTVEQELQYIEQYLAFYKARFSHWFTYEIACEEAVKQHRMPKFLLQPLVENCFKHGFSEKCEEGQIRITGKKQGDDIVLTVWDNGCGISASRLQQLQQVLNSDQESEHIGIANTHARIRLVYGAPYGLQIKSKQNCDTEITVYLKDRQE